MTNAGLREMANLLSKRHGDLTDHGTNVDKEIEILKKMLSATLAKSLRDGAYHVDTRGGQGRVDNDTLTRLCLGDERAKEALLFGDEWRNVCLETSSAETHDNNSNAKRSKCSIRVHDDRWNCRDYQNDVTDKSDDYGNSNGVEPPPLFVGNVGTKQRSDVTPRKWERLNPATSQRWVIIITRIA